MSSTHQRYRAIQTSLMHIFGQPTGHQARHVQTLVALICGIVGSTHTQLPHIADHVPNHQAKTSSVIQRMTRWYQNDAITTDTFFLPFVEPLLGALAAARPLEVIIDGSTMGRGCVTLMASVVYRGRAIPIAWTVVSGRKGHLPEATHLTLVDEVQRIIPDWAEVIFLGDGEFDGVALQRAVDAAGWQYVCRTAKNTLLWRAEQKQHASDMPVQPDRPVSWPEVSVTGQQYGPVHAIAFWDANEAQPLYLLTNLSDAAQAVRHYLRRAHIETLFSDQKSRGFRIDKSHIADPKRLARLLIAVCLAYIWIIYLGAIAHRDGWVAIIHRPDRCDLSLFQLGLRLLHHLLKEECPIPVGFILLDDALV
jgi:hypothetical protein